MLLKIYRERIKLEKLEIRYAATLQVTIYFNMPIKYSQIDFKNAWLGLRDVDFKNMILKYFLILKKMTTDLRLIKLWKKIFFFTPKLLGTGTLQPALSIN